MKTLTKHGVRVKTKNRITGYLMLILGISFGLSCGICPAKAASNNGGDISIDQAISDGAQQNTIAFDGLAFLTGDACSDTFLPPGKVADFSGFQYLRDTDPTNMGHNTDFVTVIAFNMLNILTESQIEELAALAKNQINMIENYGYNRFPLMNGFRRLLVGDKPDECEGLSLDAVKRYSAALYRLDGEISYDRADTLGNILRNLSPDQQAELENLKALNGIGNWEQELTDPLRTLYPGLSHGEHVAVMTYASEMYSWYAGSVEADTYFCPERQGTYFGSFYMKDAPAMEAKDSFTIPSNLTADMGSRFIGTLTHAQAELITGLVEVQRDALNELVETRRLISTQLRRFMSEASVDRETVLTLAERYGELDGIIVYNYATNFAAVKNTLSNNQYEALVNLRQEWNTIPCSGAYLYSAKIDMPGIINTDFLFGIGSSPDGVQDKVASILSQYDPSSLTADGARAINNAFRDAGLKRGKDLKDAIEAAGFDGAAISSLDPPLERIDKKGPPRISE